MRTTLTRLGRSTPNFLKTRTHQTRAFTMSLPTHSSNSSNQKEEFETTDSQQSTTNSPKETLALPAAPSDPTTNLDISSGSTTVSLDHLGPMVVNVDGTMSRISNWDKMAEIEKKNTLRIIGKRNKERLEALKKVKEGEA
jgi:hypothetical protein